MQGLFLGLEDGLLLDPLGLTYGIFNDLPALRLDIGLIPLDQFLAQQKTDNRACNQASPRKSSIEPLSPI
ncbi:hypothetical protein GF1_22450 [Desulfolithobacter dissulfuricans]|uniref:Uncharacterized protein n=1 Tax=Desulfolithobacter dissulfuricans TaxID=2795293 RepID=A0A915U1Z6_9BACT|nr:hypothetical protein GF1_22450 [Desulfolithobacter dissulfuricans]